MAAAVPQPGGPSDKVYHVAEFAILAVLIAGALGLGAGRGWTRPVVFGFLLAAVYGVSDEIHQLFVPTRFADLWDALADILGAAVGSAIVLWAVRRGTFGHLSRGD